MATLKKQFVNHFGLDLKSSDVVRPDAYASDMINAQYMKDGSVEKRAGYKASAGTGGGNGLKVYNRIDTQTGVESEILCSVSDTLSTLAETTFTIAYSGSDPSAVCSIFYNIDDDEYQCALQEGTAIVLDFSLGKGFDEASIIALSDLKTAVDAVTNFSATISGTTSIPAAFLDIVRSHDLTDSDAVSTAREWVDVNTPIANPLAGSESNRNNDDYENATFAQVNNVLYISNGYDYIQKYDGQNMYQAGLPAGTAPTTALVAGGSLTGTYRHSYLYSQYDAAFNLTEGNISTYSSPDLTAASQDIDVTVSNIQASSGFNTNCAIVSGVQAGVNTINVDDGSGGTHTMKIGDTAYFYDGVSAAYIERSVTAISGTTIDVDGAAVNVADNAVISNNLRIRIFRNVNGGLDRFLVEEIPSNSFSSTQVYTDSIIDNLLGVAYIKPIKDRSLPPKGRYIVGFYNQLAIAGNADNPNFLYWSDSDGPEYFPFDDNVRRFQSKNGDPISGIAQNNEVLSVFEKRAVHTVSGDILTNNIRFEVITDDIGCVAHHTIREVRGTLYFLSDRGVYTMTSGQIPQQRSELIEPAFDQTGTIDDDQRLILKRAISVNHREKELYIAYVPAESGSTNKYANDNSIMATEDYHRGAWLKWDNMNMAGGGVVYKEALWFVEKRLSGFTGNVDHILYSEMKRGDSWDYMDNTEPVEMNYATAWYSLGEPSVFKRFLRVKFFGITETNFNLFELDLDIEKNYIIGNREGTVTLDFSGSGDGYGVGEYGVEPYGDTIDPGVKHKIGPIKAKSLRLIMKNSIAQQNVNITGWEIEYAGNYMPELKE